MNASTHSPEETKSLAKSFIRGILPDTDTATVVALVGDLGSGKTTFVQGIAEALGIEGSVQSPTFVIEKRYDVPEGFPFSELVHIDAYRIDDPREMGPIQFGDSLSRPGRLVLVEWPEKIQPLIPPGAREIRFRFIDTATREIDISDAR